MNPDTSTKLKPIKLQRINSFFTIGFLDIETNKLPKTIPTPKATPPKQSRGIEEAKYLKPSNSIISEYD